MLATQLVNGATITHGSAVDATIAVPEGAAFLYLTFTTTFGTVAATNGLAITISTAPDDSTWTTYPVSPVVAGVGSSTVAYTLGIPLLDGSGAKVQPGVIADVKLALNNDDATNTILTSVIAQFENS